VKVPDAFSKGKGHNVASRSNASKKEKPINQPADRKDHGSIRDSQTSGKNVERTRILAMGEDDHFADKDERR